RKTTSCMDIDKTIDFIHHKEPELEKVKKISVDFPISLYKRVKSKAIEEEITLKGYFLRLVEKDLES
ncbi:MAG: hypothetical protein AAFR87_35340, partial [Bacteroidota bacterium]